MSTLSVSDLCVSIVCIHSWSGFELNSICCTLSYTAKEYIIPLRELPLYSIVRAFRIQLKVSSRMLAQSLVIWPNLAIWLS